VLPLALGVAAWLLFAARSLRPAIAWLVPLGIAAGLTTVSKIAFIGFGIGVPSINFTGFSGHAMFSAATYPVLAYAIVNRRGHDLAARGAGRWLVWSAVAAGFLLAILIAHSRVMVRAHSYSEVILGFALGGAASVAALWWLRDTPSKLHARWIAAGIAGWLVVMPIQASPSRSHDLVTRIALTVADRDRPFTREDMHRRVKREAQQRKGLAHGQPAMALPHAAATAR
jgi:membrane-associated phospholipid phosphatase